MCHDRCTVRHLLRTNLGRSVHGRFGAAPLPVDPRPPATMSVEEQKSQRIERAQASESLKKEAEDLVGVADVLRIYGQIEQTLETVHAYQPRDIVTSATGNCTA